MRIGASRGGAEGSAARRVYRGMRRRIHEARTEQSAAKRGRSSAGRAPVLHTGGQEFDPPRLHQMAQVLKATKNQHPSETRVRRLDVGSTPGGMPSRSRDAH